ncbi:MAG: mechanosensitive ion channel family protein [Pseudomonas sp.]|uniref:mechanosensitive ion channel family protein n=1 Tax=Pseudomonas abieticivorans TaxID=2931382 RepID=UPI0020BD4F49|nr:mechanosensitive ion channel family protein [Pseudomonas sp. PIA16]MDE1168627.1 mechanosensitive ion channel family protein [Pseudomonas sp.]
MFSLIDNHPLLVGTAFLLLDIAVWHGVPPEQRVARLLARISAFVLFSWVLISAGLSPLQPAPWPDDLALNLMATILEIIWWLFAARLLTVVIGTLLIQRNGHTGRLLQDVIGAAIFLVAIVGAAAYVMQLPVKGLLATSGAMAIVVGLALQSTLSDVFSGIVLNTTKPYQIDDWISIDGTEGKVIDIDWRATRLLTSQSSLVVIPNSVAAKAKIINLSRPANVHGVSILIQVPTQVRPQRVLDALDRALQGTSALMISPRPKVSVKSASVEFMEYEACGFINTMENKGEVRNLLFDLAHRHLEAAGVVWNSDIANQPWTRQRTLLEEVKVFRSLSSEDKDQLSLKMLPVEYPAGQVILALGAVSEHLLIIGTGVVSALIPSNGALVEAGRMGPGEIMGEENIITEGTSEAEFRTLTTCILFRIDKEAIRAGVEQRSEVKAALTKLQHYRQRASQSLLLQKPAEIKRGGFLNWLHKK